VSSTIRAVMLPVYGYGDTTKLKKHRIWDTTCIYMLSLKLSTNTLPTYTKMNPIYLSNI